MGLQGIATLIGGSTGTGRELAFSWGYRCCCVGRDWIGASVGSLGCIMVDFLRLLEEDR